MFMTNWIVHLSGRSSPQYRISHKRISI